MSIGTGPGSHSGRRGLWCERFVHSTNVCEFDNYRKAMSDDSVDGSIDSYGPVVVAGDLGAAQGRGSDRLGPYETAFSASITVPHDMTDTQVAMPAELFRVPVVDLCNIHQQDSLLGDPTERNARNGLGISTQGAIPALHSALAQHAGTKR